MSASTNPADHRERLDYAEIVARIERMNAETAKLVEEAPKLAAERERLAAEAREAFARIDRAQAETRKFAAEQNKLAEEATKLAAEARKLDRDRSIAPLLLVIAALGAAIASIPVLARLFGMVWPSP